MLSRSRESYHNELFENNIDSAFNLRKTINPIINPRKTTTRTVINKLVFAGKKITNKQVLPDTMNRHFCDFSVRSQSESPNYGNRFLEYVPPRISNSVCLAPTCKDDVLLEIKKMKPMKAPGHDFDFEIFYWGHRWPFITDIKWCIWYSALQISIKTVIHCINKHTKTVDG